MVAVFSFQRSVIGFGSSVVEWAPNGCVTVMHDGVRIEAEPEDTDSYRETAQQCGYGDDTLALCREHELAHSALAALYGIESPVMRAVGTGAAFGEVHALEEAAVMAMQTWANAVGVRLAPVFWGAPE